MNPDNANGSDRLARLEAELARTKRVVRRMILAAALVTVGFVLAQWGPWLYAAVSDSFIFSTKDSGGATDRQRLVVPTGNNSVTARFDTDPNANGYGTNLQITTTSNQLVLGGGSLSGGFSAAGDTSSLASATKYTILTCPAPAANRTYAIQDAGAAANFVLTDSASTAVGDVLYSDGSYSFGRLADVTAGSYLRSGGSSTAPLWSTLTLPNAATTGDILYASGSNAIGNLADVAAGEVLVSGGVGAAPSYSATPTLGVNATTTGKLILANGGAGGASVTIQNNGATSAYNFNLPTGPGSSGQILESGGGGSTAMTWTTATYPATGGTAGNYLRSDGMNFVSTPVTYAQPAAVQNPAGTSNAGGLMMGLGVTLTPARSGTVLIIVSGNITNNTASDGGKAQIRYGTGAAPANAAALTGTAVGPLAQVSNVRSNAVPFGVPFSVQTVVTGLAVGTQIWVDLSLAAVTGGTATLTSVSVTIIEL